MLQEWVPLLNCNFKAPTSTLGRFRGASNDTFSNGHTPIHINASGDDQVWIECSILLGIVYGCELVILLFIPVTHGVKRL